MARRKLQPVREIDPAYTGGLGLTPRPSQPPASPVEPAPGPAQSNEPPAMPPAAADPEPEVSTGPAPAPTTPRTARPRPARTRPEAPPVAAPKKRIVIAVNARPLAMHVEQMAATGLPEQDVMKAAWRKTAARVALAPVFVEPPSADRAGGSTHVYSTTLTLDGSTLAALTEAQDPLGVKSPWSLVRGQIEPVFWAALDEVLAQVGRRT
ncbi:hypothetical protein [Rubellimicrobium roseum]|uniref:Uncharacterized protein n=1 Tax=Rubellimicrobium roseum TaxID=687525 RepID=A0A5C4NB80_9RHOB|nr:hypothetical protein [Rubellimicrobium roseum]TNC66265.1 hypothetical protein FHG71_16755 [Rubellimicrobium roseum]